MNRAESVAICKPMEITICKVKKADHPKLVAFDDHMYKLEGELRSARRALYEYKIFKPETNFPYELRQHAELTGHMDTLDGDMRKLEWKIYDTRETLLDMVRHWGQDESSEYSDGEDGSGGTDVSDTDVSSSEDGSSNEDKGVEWGKAEAEAYENRLQEYGKAEQEERKKLGKYYGENLCSTEDESGDENTKYEN